MTIYSYLVVHIEGKYSYPCGAAFLDGKYSNARLLTEEEADTLLASLQAKYPNETYEILEVIPF
jgi:hypothetical protein